MNKVTINWFVSEGEVCWRFDVEMDIDSNQITEIADVKNISSCQIQCQSDSQCDFWQYDPMAETCGKTLGNNFDYNKNTSLAIKSVIGMKNCKPVVPFCKLNVNRIMQNKAYFINHFFFKTALKKMWVMKAA